MFSTVLAQLTLFWLCVDAGHIFLSKYTGLSNLTQTFDVTSVIKIYSKTWELRVHSVYDH